MYGNPSLWSVIHRLKFPDYEPDCASRAPWVALQRPFVWNEEQIAKLFDSIMRGFPIGTLLIWRTDAAVKHQNFVEEWPGSAAAACTDPQQSTGTKNIVLDGHQRLQGLLIGLAGSYHGRELYFDVTSGEQILPDGTRYRFSFNAADVGWPWVRFKSLVGEMLPDQNFAGLSDESIAAAFSSARTEAESHLVADNVNQAVILFTNVGQIYYESLVRDTFEQNRGRPENYTVEEAAEIFRRINASGPEPDLFVTAVA